MGNLRLIIFPTKGKANQANRRLFNDSKSKGSKWSHIYSNGDNFGLEWKQRISDLLTNEKIIDWDDSYVVIDEDE
jgi:hypothetical protein